jgi:hypothetical protein
MNKLLQVVAMACGFCAFFGVGFVTALQENPIEKKSADYLAATIPAAAKEAWERAHQQEADKLDLKNGFTPKITTGYRAVWLPVDDLLWKTAVWGDRIDILINRYPPREDDQPTTYPEAIYFAQDMKILDKRETDTEGKVFIVEGTPDEAQIFALAKAAAKRVPGSPPPFTVALRNPQDDGFLERLQRVGIEAWTDPAQREDWFQRSRARRVQIYGGGRVRNQ